MTDKILLIGGDDGLPRRLATALEAAGAHPHLVLKEARDLSAAMVVYLAASRGGGAPDLEDAEAFFRQCMVPGLKDSSSPQLVLVSSSAVFQPSHRHLGMRREGQLLRAPAGSLAEGWRKLEETVRAVVGERLTILRPCALPVEDGTDLFSRLFSSRRPIVPWGFDPPLQILSVEDLARALLATSKAAPGGTYHLAPKAVIPLRRALGRGGRKGLPVPGFFLQRQRADAFRHPFTVDAGAAAEALAWQPQHSSAEALDANFERPLGEPEPHDDFGLDRDQIDFFGRTFFRFLHDMYWRMETRGLEHVPREGRAVLAGIHRGFQPWDGVMILHVLARERSRIPRFLLHPALLKTPWIAPFLMKLGGLPACQENGARVLESGELLGIFPEGIQGAFSLYRDAYKLKRFGRNEFVRLALRQRAPIVPFVTLGSAEACPIFGKFHWRWWKRLSGWPCLPITVPLPLPSKWHTEFLEPLPVHEEYPPEAADDSKVVQALSGEVRNRLENSLTAMRQRRKSIFFGSIFRPQPEVPEGKK